MIADPLIVSMYWISLVFIGYGFVLLIKKLSSRIRSFKLITDIIARQPGLIVILISFALSCIIFSFLSIGFYLFHSPVSYAVYIYIFLLLLSCVLVFDYFQKIIFENNRRVLRFFPRGKNVLTQIMVALVTTTIVVDLIIAFLTKSNVGGDAIYHMSRVLNIVNEGFTTASSLFSTSPEGSYHVNVIYTLYAIPTMLFNLDPMRVWELSLPFFRLLQWLVAYTVASFAWNKWITVRDNKDVLILLTTVTGYFAISPRLFVATYPNQIVVAWITLMIIVSSSFFKKPKLLLLTAAPLALLISLTHPIYALLTALYLGSFALIFTAREFKKIKSFFAAYAVLVISLTILMIGPIITYRTPSMVNTDKFSVGTEKVIGSKLLNIADPSLIVQPSLIRNVIFIITIVSGIYLIAVNWRNKIAASSIIAILTLPIFVLYFPPLFTILHTALPVWVLQRFDAINLIIFASWTVFFWMILDFIFGKIKILKNYQQNKVLFFCILSLLGILFMLKTVYPETITYALQNNKTYADNSLIAKDFKGILNSNKLVIMDPAYGYMVTSELDIDLLAVEKGHFPVASDAQNRIKCLDNILRNYSAVDLYAVKADFVMLPKSEASSALYKNIKDKSYIKPIAENEQYIVYKVVIDDNIIKGQVADRSCVLYQQNERILLK